MSTVLDVIGGAMLLVGGVVVLATAVALLRARDAFTKINELTPATVLGLPLIVTGAFLAKTADIGFMPSGLVRAIITTGALIIVSSVASNTLARAAYLSGAQVDPRTRPNDLAIDPAPDLDQQN